MISELFKEVDLQNEPWGVTIKRLKQLVMELLNNPAKADERAIQVFVREAMMQIDAEPRLIHKAIVIDVQQALERLVAANPSVNQTGVVASGAEWFRRYGLNVSACEATMDSLPLFFVLWKQRANPQTEKAAQA